VPQAPDLAYACRLPPQDAIAYLESKGYAIGFSWTDVWQEAHAKAFTAAGVMKVDVLADLKGGLVDALTKRHDAAGLSPECNAAAAAQGLVGRRRAGGRNHRGDGRQGADAATPGDDLRHQPAVGLHGRAL
jgi:uncharacterized protein with gpF-like domain